MRALGFNAYPGMAQGVLRTELFDNVVHAWDRDSVGHETVQSLGIEDVYPLEAETQPDLLYTRVTTLEDVHAACDYAISKSARCVLFGLHKSQWRTRELIENTLIPKGYRVCHIALSALTFNCCQSRMEQFVLAYPQDCIFNVKVPKLPPLYTLGEALDELDDEDTFGILQDPDGRGYKSGDHTPICSRLIEVYPKIAQGWTFKNVCRYQRDLLAGFSEREIALYGSVWKLAPGVYVPHMGVHSRWWLHPSEPRTFTLRELSWMCDWEECPVGSKQIEQCTEDTPPGVMAWLVRQIHNCLAGERPAQDFEVRYNEKTGKFDGDAIPESRPIKHLDLYAYYPRKT